MQIIMNYLRKWQQDMINTLFAIYRSTLEFFCLPTPSCSPMLGGQITGSANMQQRLRTLLKGKHTCDCSAKSQTGDFLITATH